MNELESSARQAGWRGRRLRRIVPAGAVALAICAWGGWWLAHRSHGPRPLVLYGNVDLRDVDLAFNDSGRIERVWAHEGQRVRKGQLLAQLDTSRLRPQLAQAEAESAAQRAVLERLRHGSRPQQILQARANLALARARRRQAHDHYRRLEALSRDSFGRAVSRQDLDDAQTAYAVAQETVSADQQALQLRVLGPRPEDIAQAEALLEADQARVALIEQQLADANLRAPLDAVVRSRAAEPGDMASPQKSAFTLAITDPKWVRAYVTERELGEVRPGMPARIAVDSFPKRRFSGRVGFLSSEAEFTPRTVQTPQLRTSLVYEVRVFVRDPRDDLRLGMPATVYLARGGRRR